MVMSSLIFVPKCHPSLVVAQALLQGCFGGFRLPQGFLLVVSFRCGIIRMGYILYIYFWGRMIIYYIYTWAICGIIILWDIILVFVKYTNFMGYDQCICIPILSGIRIILIPSSQEDKLG